MTQEADAIRAAIRKFVLEECLPGEDWSAITDDDELVDTGVLDSVAMLKAVTFIEDRWSLEVGEEDLVPENFRSIRALAGFVEGRIGR